MHTAQQGGGAMHTAQQGGRVIAYLHCLGTRRSGQHEHLNKKLGLANLIGVISVGQQSSGCKIPGLGGKRRSYGRYFLHTINICTWKALPSL